MSIVTPVLCGFTHIYQNQQAGSNTPGTSVAPGASNAEGSWTALTSNTDLTDDVEYIEIGINNGTTNTAIKDHAIDIGVDPAGGTSYTEVLPDLIAGNSFSNAQGSRWFHFPMYIKAGSTVAARVKGSNATAGTVRVFVRFWGKPSRPELWRRPAYFETIGVTNAAGVSFTPGNATFGSWASLGSTTKDLWWFQTGTGITNGTMGAETCRVQMAVGDGTNFHVINDFFMYSSTSEQIGSNMQGHAIKFVPGGSTLYVRGAANAAPTSGYHAAVVGAGG